MASGGETPHEDTAIDLKSDDAIAAVAALCVRLVPGWRGLSATGVQAQTIGGGITNVLLMLTHEHADCKLIVRIFGDNTEVLIDRDRELRILKQLNAFGFGAAVLATFANGRVEEFLECRTLVPDELRHANVVPRVAARLARFHAATVDEADKSPQLWAVVEKWLAMASTISFDDVPQKAQQFALVDLGMMQREVRATRALCDQTRSPVVYSHNDLLAGNVLALGDNPALDSADLSVQLIDFEYSTYSFRGFDWGNHFNEWAGFDCDWSKYPTEEEQTTFIRAYLEAAHPGAVPAEQVLAGVAEAGAFSLASHIYWGVWALTQARYSPIDFDYLSYSATRWARYHDQKSVVAAKVLEHFGQLQ